MSSTKKVESSLTLPVRYTYLHDSTPVQEPAEKLPDNARELITTKNGCLFQQTYIGVKDTGDLITVKFAGLDAYAPILLRRELHLAREFSPSVRIQPRKTEIKMSGRQGTSKGKSIAVTMYTAAQIPHFAEHTTYKLRTLGIDAPLAVGSPFVAYVTNSKKNNLILLPEAVIVQRNEDLLIAPQLNYSFAIAFNQAAGQEFLELIPPEDRSDLRAVCAVIKSQYNYIFVSLVLKDPNKTSSLCFTDATQIIQLLVQEHELTSLRTLSILYADVLRLFTLFPFLRVMQEREEKVITHMYGLLTTINLKTMCDLDGIEATMFSFVSSTWIKQQLEALCGKQLKFSLARLEYYLDPQRKTELRSELLRAIEPRLKQIYKNYALDTAGNVAKQLNVNPNTACKKLIYVLQQLPAACQSLKHEMFTYGLAEYYVEFLSWMQNTIFAFIDEESENNILDIQIRRHAYAHGNDQVRHPEQSINRHLYVLVSIHVQLFHLETYLHYQTKKKITSTEEPLIVFGPGTI